MREFESEEGTSYADVLILLVHHAGVTVSMVGKGQERLARLQRILPDGTLARAVLHVRSDPAEVVDAAVIRTICHRLGLSAAQVESLFGWTLPDYPED